MNVGLPVQAGHSPGWRRRCQRRAAAAVEAAITLPLLILLVFGAMEVANGIFLNQALSVAAYEGAREAVRPGGTSDQAETRIAEVLASRSIGNYVISIEPTVTDSTSRGTPIAVQIQAPMNSFVGHSVGLLGNRLSTQKVCMVKH